MLVGVTLAQGAVGYTQYFTGVPPLLVGVHVLGACLLWIAVLLAYRGLLVPAPVPPEALRPAEALGGSRPAHVAA